MKDENKKEILNECENIKNDLSNFLIEIDSRDQYTPGWKFNDWEMKGVPLRIEIGPKDIEKKQAVIVRRDTREKKFVKQENLKEEVTKTLNEIQINLLEKARKFIENNKVKVDTFDDFIKATNEKKIIEAPWCGEVECEENIKFKAKGTKSLNIPFNQEKITKKCVFCDKKAKYYALFAKSY
jgi:prolyl-tRNA synthetase